MLCRRPPAYLPSFRASPAAVKSRTLESSTWRSAGGRRVECLRRLGANATRVVCATEACPHFGDALRFV